MNKVKCLKECGALGRCWLSITSKWAFSVAGPRLWKQLPDEVLQVRDLCPFKWITTSCLFRQAIFSGLLDVLSCSDCCTVSCFHLSCFAFCLILFILWRALAIERANYASYLVEEGTGRRGEQREAQLGRSLEGPSCAAHLKC